VGLKVGEKKEELLKNKMYKFSHIAIYGGDEEQEIKVSRTDAARNEVDGTAS